MPTDRCSTDLAELYDAIMARLKGKAINSAGAKGRSVGYAETKLDDMIAMYRQLYKQCGDGSGLPPIENLLASSGQRGVLRVSFGR
jgi:hypothetical protein